MCLLGLSCELKIIFSKAQCFRGKRKISVLIKPPWLVELTTPNEP